MDSNFVAHVATRDIAKGCLIVVLGSIVIWILLALALWAILI